MNTSFLIRALSASALLALAACQTQDPGTLSLSSATTDQDTELRLVVKDSAECLALRDSLKAGSADSAARAAFIAACVVEVPPPKPLPPRPVPPQIRCQLVSDWIDSGRVGLIRLFAKHCSEVCDSLAVSDSAAYAAKCVVPPRPPRPTPPPHDSVRPPRDTIRPEPPPCDTVRPEPRPLPPPREALCDSLKAELAAADTSSAEYRPLAHRTAAVCKLPPPPPPRERPAPAAKP